jgi:hypothetical protein
MTEREFEAELARRYKAYSDAPDWRLDEKERLSKDISALQEARYRR